MQITSVRTRLMYIQTFLRYGIDEGFVSLDVFGRKIRLQLPEHLPRAMDPEDVRQILSVIAHNRDRAMILVLLRTGMRIGELLNMRVADVHLGERRVEIYEGEKNRLGRVVYLSDDAVDALNLWFKERDPRKEYLLYDPPKIHCCLRRETSPPHQGLAEDAKAALLPQASRPLSQSLTVRPM